MKSPALSPLFFFSSWILAATGLFADNLPLTQEQQQSMTPQVVLDSLMEGNARYVAGETTKPNIQERVAASSMGQFPKAVVLSCFDARVPTELVFDSGIGNMFVGRIAGNIENNDLLGSMEFGTELSGARLILVLGHSSCGAIRGACAGAELGHLTGLLAKIKPAIDRVDGFEGEERSASNEAFVDAVAEENVLMTIENIREKSPILADLEKFGEIMIVGAMYNLATGQVTLIEE